MRLRGLLRRLTRDPVKPDDMTDVLADTYHFAAELRLGAKRVNDVLDRKAAPGA